MPDEIIVDIEREEIGLIPDRWVLGTGLTTDGLYIIHTDAPFLILKYPLSGSADDTPPCTVYFRGETNPEQMNLLFTEAWKIVESYRDNVNKMHSTVGKLLSRLN